MCSKVSLVAICKFLIISAEVITLIKDNELKCVLTEESLNFPVLVTNHDCLEFKRKRTLLKLDDNSDWKVSQDIDMFEVKSDIRLAEISDIEPSHTNSLLLKNSTFFICVNKHFKLEIRNEIHDTLGTINVERETSDNQSCEWRLCKLLFLTNNNTVVLQKCGTYSKSFNETKLWIEFQERPQFYIPEYYYSNKINENNISIHLNSSDCVSMFVSVDEGCILEIYINNNLTQIEGFNKKGQLKTWKLQKILTNGAKLMTINRTSKESNKTEGFWGIYQIRECQLNNIEIIKTTCKNITNETRCEPYNKETKVSSRIWNKPYYLANKSCEQILGSTYKHCENHKICFGDKCKCAWGFKGPNCNETCMEPNNGLDCEEIYFRPFFNSSNSNINVYLNLTHIRISWLSPSLHFIENRCESKFCKTTDVKGEEISTKNKIIYVKNQAFENCKLTFLTQNKTQLEKINFDTKTNFPIQNSEIPNLEIDISGISVRLNKCENFQGALNYSIKYKCLNGTCNNKTESFLIELRDSYKESFKINTTLELNVSYEFNITARRQKEKKSKIFNITCKPGVPQPLRHLSLYGSNSQNISIRWMEPYPLTGRIEKIYFSFEKNAIFEQKTNTSKNSNNYKTTYTPLRKLIYNYFYTIFKPSTNNNSKSLNTFKEINWTKCESWENFFCGDLPRPNNSSDFNFTIYVRYKYFNVSNPSNSTELNISKLDNFSHAPENIRVKCSNRKPSEIVLEWEQPSYINGKFNVFNITLKNLTNEKYINKQIKKYEKKYNQTISINENEDLEIAIQVANGTSEVATVSVLGKSINNNLYLHYLNKGIYYLSVPKNDETCKLIKNEFGLNCSYCESEADTYFCKVKSTIKNKSSTTWKAKATTIASQTVTITKEGEKNLIITKSTTHNFNKEEKEKKNNSDTSLKNLVTDNSTIATVTISVTVVILGVIGISLIFCFWKTKREINKVETPQNNSPTIPRSTKLSNLNTSELCSLLELDVSINEEKTVNRNRHKSSSSVVQCEGFENYSLKSLERKIPWESDCESEIKCEKFEKITKNHKSEFSLDQDSEDNLTKIQINTLESYLKRTLLTTNELIDQLGTLLLKNKASSYHALQIKNKNKNKHQKHIPYDYNRVVLRPLEGVGKDDYINGIENPKAYIATQGPKFYTIRDFWRMIWQEEVETIVMATNFFEANKRKCAEYFPLTVDSVFECGEIYITLLSEEMYEHHVIRYLSVRYKDHKREIQHFQLKWSPNSSNPMYPNMVVPLVRKISSIREQSFSPIVVHCSSGVNRTGTLLLCDLAFQMAKKHKCVDFYNILKRLRDQRPYMIPNKKQYLLAHLIVLECVMEEENIFKKSLNENMNEEILKKQLLYIDRISWHNSIIDKLMSRDPEQNQIMDTCYTVDGYMHRKKFLTTEIPDVENLNSFWKFVITENINVIVILQKEKERMWPFRRRNPRTIISVKERSKTETWYSIVTELQIIVYHLQGDTVIFEKTIYCFKIKCDNPLESESTKELLCILDDVNNFSIDHENKKPLIICNDGIKMCGLFTSLSYIIEKYQQEVEIDICNALQTVRKSGAPFIKTTEELEFLYKAMSKYLTKFDKYSHIM